MRQRPRLEVAIVDGSKRKYRTCLPSAEDTTVNGAAGVLTPGFLRFVGELLFGERWQTPLAQHLGAVRGKALAPATVHQWSTRTRSIPAWVVDALLTTLDRSQHDLDHRARLARDLAQRMRGPGHGAAANGVANVTAGIL